MKKYQWLIHTPNGGAREVGSFAKAVEQLKGRPCFASLTHRRFLRRSNNVIYYPMGYSIERICLTKDAPDKVVRTASQAESLPEADTVKESLSTPALAGNPCR